MAGEKVTKPGRHAGRPTTLGTLRRGIGLKVAEVAKRAGLPISVASRLDAGIDEAVSIAAVRRYAEALGGDLEVYVKIGERGLWRLRLDVSDVSGCAGDPSGDTGGVAAKKSAAKAAAGKVSTVKKAVKAPPKRGRPARADGAATEAILFRVTRTEYAELQAVAAAAGKPLATFVRDLALSVTEKR